MADNDGILSSLRYLFADFLGDDDDTPPFLPEALPESLSPVVRDAIHLLLEYQGAGYARLYVDRLWRFIGRRGVSEALLGDIARLMAERMAYQDPIRIARLKLAGLDQAGAGGGSAEAIRFRLDELIEALPAVVAGPALDALEWAGWVRRSRVSIRFSNRSRLGIRCLKIGAGLRRWRLYSVRYARERAWVERWLHMIDRCLTGRPQAAQAIVATATMIKGYGETYGQGLADWHAIIDGLAKPSFDGVLAFSDLAGAIEEARTAAMPDPRQAALKRKIDAIRARVPAA